ncbi:MAG: AAA family ATPase [Gammaproteobacteria bacterium]
MINTNNSSKANLEGIEASLQGNTDFQLQSKLIVNGHMDPLHGENKLPDILVLDLSLAWKDELKALSQRSRSERPTMIAIGAEGNPEMMRLAMKAGARDFFTHPVVADELVNSLCQIVEDSSSTNGAKAKISAVINAKGGSGASFLASNLAHIAASHYQLKMALIDLDLQFGSLPLYLDLSPREGIIEAVANIDQLDSTALKAHMTKHESGLHLLASKNDQLSSNWTISENSLIRLLEIASNTYTHLLVDLPRQIDPLTTTVLERADQILVVIQQDIASLRDAKQLIRIITSVMGVPKGNLQIFINRHNPKSAITEADIKEALNIKSVSIIPNDFKRAVEATNTGVPLYVNERNAAITKSLINLVDKICDKPAIHKKGIFTSLSNILRS